ncbi:uncharacterized protein TNCV_4938681 [Trichonephila clavipes]|nr:uncharacterized protein TNCV_4938681 [Trichonephila clavipes]
MTASAVETPFLCVDMLTLWMMPQLQDDIDNFILLLKYAPPHSSVNMQDYLDEDLPHRWIGRAMDYNKPFTQWPPRSPDVTHCDFFLGGVYLRNTVFVLSLPVDLAEMEHSTTTTIDGLGSDT